ncbi:MAG: 2-oxoglutarate dehydrogenase, E2 component, dihydrolipoamide succinyltransferase [Gemmatimonadetes bacterium]|uniref:Dihydrolipoamide acetyltransferase component of pyruvate dehydrogenase complex n=1 Tax=Candidatus Kutchimonas denitrificans TaxID=3056748 RepID=A0AAE4Z8G5_9BACT|nr:2-oxoglutarate dehydrogenase, E2 component, dihydrolipoamide succinyltransferase [Gemmatimonadota bacterium]NIR74106.1 2-oxoglutarate dehydrogenase, E2 component, dihydrolipoamide succinyltransferase [Candidatus Kutchimonas denitrificans]NIS01288.1 2-oxoglutarate dehydrogenase, E2 component, dihydrolipoamide succinyltransferase [Gemmatimonadota bacterium]NIT67019.1 2-oxoglutarate dehydrogenase, E2 component, dihydrolipoamide succinyltransferase [Gemmatimonadota bacterium]NIU51679.1 2-oxoglut
MAKVDVIMPQMGESIAEGTITRWLVNVGEEVKRDQSILEISTDKVDADIPSPTSGRLLEILVDEGQTVEVGTVVARIETDAAAAAEAEAAQPPAEPEAPLEPKAEPETRPEPEARPAPAPAATPEPGDGDGGPQTREERLRTRSTPLVRRIAAEHGIDISSLSGSGVAGRVTKKDILSFIEEGGAAAAAEPRGKPGVIYAPIHGETLEIKIPEVAIKETDRVEEMGVMRQRIMEHMLMSRRISAHVSSVFEIDFERVAEVRAALKPRFEEDGVKLTYLPFIVKAVLEGLKEYPVVNASVVGRKIVYHGHYNIGIAVAMDEGAGLIVPVVRNVDELSLLGIARRTQDLAARARNRQLDPEDVQGGTFTITNPGVFGSLFGTPIINQPQVAILGVGAIEKRPVVIDDMIAVRRRAYFGLTFDHRVVDGAIGDFFMSKVKDVLEDFPEEA